MHKAIKPVKKDTACCSGYKEFTFYGVAFPESYTIYNSTASNYIIGTVDAVGLQTLRVTIPSLSLYQLNEKSIQVIGTTTISNDIIPGYNSNNTVDISWADLGALEGIFTIRIWVDQLELI